MYKRQEYNGIAKMFSDTVGAPANYWPVNYSGGNKGYIPYEAMVSALSEPVSYTHLDVYKRQPLHRMECGGCGLILCLQERHPACVSGLPYMKSSHFLMCDKIIWMTGSP